MVFIKGMKPTKGFTGRKHSEATKKLMGEMQKSKRIIRDNKGRFLKIV